ncbi:MAG: hypothetical protein LBH36_02205 [Candidatus Nomurabacteria bacterium]|jgi:hypothetical protein|nr:hypothetical protein [Candidatus Nomurabacteria bacterium]
MSQLAKLLQANTHRLDFVTSSLNKNCHMAIDAKLMGDLHETVARAMHNLGLDPENTTGPELYRALGNRFHEDFKQLVKTPKFDKKALQKLMEQKGSPRFWRDTLWAGALYDKRPLSFNVFDMFQSFSADIPYAAHGYENFKESLLGELVSRYEARGANHILLDKLKHVTIVQENNTKKGR